MWKFPTKPWFRSGGVSSKNSHIFSPAQAREQRLQKLLSSAGYCGNEAIPLWLTTWPWKMTLFV